MSDHREVCQFLINTLTKFGLGLHGGKRLKVTFIMLVTVPFLTISLMLSTDYASCIEDKVRVFQMIPLFVLIAVKALNTKVKFKSILSLIETTNGMLQGIEQNSTIKQSHNTAMKIMKFILLLNVLATVLSQVTAILSHQLTIPSWIPIVGHETAFFWLNWFIYYFCGFFVQLLTLPMDALVLNLMMTLKGYSQVLRENILELPKDNKKRKDNILQFMRQVHELKS